MASAYAISQSVPNRHGRGHQHYPSLNGIPSEETSPETTFSPEQHEHSHHVHHHDEHNHHHAHAHNHEAHDHFPSNGYAINGHAPTVSQKLPMKGRVRGESDLGASAHSRTHKQVPSSWFSLPEALAGLLIPLPYLFASTLYSSSLASETPFPPLSAYARLQAVATGHQESGQNNASHSQASSVVQSCALTSGTLLLVGILAQLRSRERVLDRRKNPNAPLQVQAGRLLSMPSVLMMSRNAVGLTLPFYASMQLGGMRVGLLMLAAAASGLVSSEALLGVSGQAHSSSLTIVVLIAICIVADTSGVTAAASLASLALGYLSLLVSIFLLPPPLPVASTSSTGARSNPNYDLSVSFRLPLSPLTITPSHSLNTLAAGVVSALLTVILSMVLTAAPSLSPLSITLSTLSLVSTLGLVLLVQPSALVTRLKTGLALGCLLSATSAFLFSPSTFPGTVANGAISALSYIGVIFEASSFSTSHEHHDHDHVNTGHSHKHHNHLHVHTPTDVSFLTKFLLAHVEPGSLMHGILCEKDSRRIAYFTTLNFAFMLVQAFYGWVSGSLGLLSDTVHMFFDCLALVVGLAAAVASKWPTSLDKPYGWGKLNTLAGFGNGIFLMLVSIEFVWEAVEGIMEGKEIRRVHELLIVSTLGFLVNMIGLLAFGHAHAGHDHGGHSHGHSHDHAHDHASHSHDHSHSHNHSQDHSHGHSHAVSQVQNHNSLYGADNPAQKHQHAHNENMEGIYLHIAADAGGSLAVIFSTSLTLWKPWYLWDPLATILIAALIFMAAVPLVKESGRKLLLVIPDELEYGLKNALQELVTLRGVTGYAVPRFWVEDREAEDAHGHAHAHGHGHSHGDEAKEVKVLGVIHVFASRIANMEEVRELVVSFFAERNMEVVVQVEREGEGRCWCGGGIKTG